MKNLEDYINVKKHNSENYELSCLEFVHSENSEDTSLLQPKMFHIKSKLNQTDKTKIKELLVEKIVNLSNKNDIGILNTFTVSNIIDNYTDENIRKLISKIKNASAFVAAVGRYGFANIILVSEKNYENLKLSELQQNFTFLFDDSIDDIYIYRKNNNIDEPGLILIDNEEKYDIVEIGSNPENQFMKITLT